MASGADLTNHVCSSDASAQSWGEPIATNLPGQTSAVVELGDGRLCVVYTDREGRQQPGIMAALSEDGGKTWDLDSQLRLWDATGRDRLGVVSLDTYPRSHRHRRIWRARGQAHVQRRCLRDRGGAWRRRSYMCAGPGCAFSDEQGRSINARTGVLSIATHVVIRPSSFAQTTLTGNVTTNR